MLVLDGVGEQQLLEVLLEALVDEGAGVGADLLRVDQDARLGGEGGW